MYNEVYQVASLQLLSHSGQKGGELRKGEWSNFKSRAWRTPMKVRRSSRICPHYMVGGPNLPKNYYTHKRPRTYYYIQAKIFYNGYKYPKSRTVCPAPTEFCTVSNSSTNIGSTHLNLSLLAYNEQ